jgi:hypothetical protein
MTDEIEIEAESVQPTYPETAPLDEQRRAWIFTWWSVHGYTMKETLRDCAAVEKWLTGSAVDDEKKPKLAAVPK